MGVDGGRCRDLAGHAGRDRISPVIYVRVPGWVDKFKTEGFISAIALHALCFCVGLESDDAATLFR
jgi:hypothetical protein